MALTYGNVRDWDADVVDEAGNTVRKRKNRLLGLEDDLAAMVVSWRWSGDAATAARQKIGTLNDRAEHVVAEASSVQRALYDASDGVRDLQHAVQDADAKAVANQYTITSDGAIRDDAPPMPQPQSRFEAEEMADIHRTSSGASNTEKRFVSGSSSVRRSPDPDFCASVLTWPPSFSAGAWQDPVILTQRAATTLTVTLDSVRRRRASSVCTIAALSGCPGSGRGLARVPVAHHLGRLLGVSGQERRQAAR
ncbi:MAG: hypothetical protein LC799_31615 [Actinobacteria bacterium]|nr:hypothetical protein [Actinomycetota bacterium]